MNEQLRHIASTFETTSSRTNSWQRIIRCCYNLQWVVQERTSADFNKGYWLGLSYHTSCESQITRYSGATGLNTDKLKSRINHVAEMDHPIHE